MREAVRSEWKAYWKMDEVSLDYQGDAGWEATRQALETAQEETEAALAAYENASGRESTAIRPMDGEPV